jgi:hypothetical protein
LPPSDWNNRLTRERLTRNLFIAGAAFGFANFIAFGIGAAILGGDAVNGKQEGDRYYVCNHGKYTEVSQAAFAYSRIHAHSTWVTHPIAILSMLLAHSYNERLKRPSNGPPETSRK